MNITIENIRHFCAVVENGGVHKAADKLYISPSSLTRSIKILEEELNKPLFDRVGRNLCITAQGESFFDESRTVLFRFQNLMRSNEASSQLMGHYRIGGSHFLCRTLIADLVAILCKKFPQASFDLQSLDSNYMIHRLKRSELDLGFSFSPKATAVTEGVKLFEGDLLLCAAPDHPLMKAKPSQVVKKISAFPATIHKPSDSIDRCDNHPMFKKFGISPQIRAFWDNDDTAIQLMNQQPMWSMMPDIIVNSVDKIKAFNHPKEWKAKYQVYMVYHRSRMVTDLKNAILDQFKRSRLLPK